MPEIATSRGEMLLEIRIPDRGIGVAYYLRQESDSKTFTIESHRPNTMHTYDFYDHVNKSVPREFGSASPQRKTVEYLTGQSYRTSDLPAAIQTRLGYSYSNETETSDGVVHTETRFTYPTVTSLNTFLDKFYPEGDIIHFAEFPGSRYEPLEFMQQFVERGEVLISTVLPWEVHDIDLHVLGWLGLAGKFSSSLRALLPLPLDVASAQAPATELDVVSAYIGSSFINEVSQPAFVPRLGNAVTGQIERLFRVVRNLEGKEKDEIATDVLKRFLRLHRPDFY